MAAITGDDITKHEQVREMPLMLGLAYFDRIIKSNTPSEEKDESESE